ncbi:DotU family type IV/VI secretion system protein [Desulfoluna sp.]|uniref:DotU family type IV/VI secretion system protein n=1 Tax=Desulfoluna sp. TaxID=2045199 RepID=UPI00263452DA|nr:DotU family type IV/VI secretion system protein [Desulfoluna sp.]
MQNKYWEAIHEVYTKLETLCGKRVFSEEGGGASDESRKQGESVTPVVEDEPGRSGTADLVAVRADLRTQLDFLRATLSEQYSERDTYLILFPIVAQIDEKILASFLEKMHTSWPSLQKELFQIENAGEVFYEIMDDILLKPQTSLFIFEVYYFCLSYGFRGRYQDNPVKIKEYMKNLSIKLEQDELAVTASVTEENTLVSHLESPYLGYLFSAGCFVVAYLVLVVAGRNLL